MNVREMRTGLGLTQSEFASRYNIPFRTIQNWESGVRKAPAYIIDLLEKRVSEDLVNHRTASLPVYNPQKKNLPDRNDYVGALAWLRAVRDILGDKTVFALDEALICLGYFGGYSSNYVVWIYGDDSAKEYNGVTVIGNSITQYQVEEKNGLLFSDFNRTLSDAFANESILDMQGITEALSRYYYTNGESFKGISVAPEYQEKFEKMAADAVAYYNS